MAILAAAGLGLEALAAASGTSLVGSRRGHLGMTLVFDAFELRRQFHRVCEGERGQTRRIPGTGPMSLGSCRHRGSARPCGWVEELAP